MDRSHDVAVLVGSLRKGSFTRLIAKALIELAPASLELEIVEIGDLPHYNPDREEDPPAAWTDFRERIRKADAFLFLTPEYNRSMPGALKNAIDVATRPVGKNAWKDKPGAVASVSPGAIGAFGAHHHLRQVLVNAGVPVMAQPEVYLGGVKNLLDEDGKLVAESTREFLSTFLKAFERWTRLITASTAEGTW